MSQENVELVRSIFAGWERGDFSSADWAHPQIEYAAVGETPTPGSAKGLAEMAGRWRVFLRTWEEFRAEAEEYRELDDERVLVLAHMGGRGKASGLDLGEMRTKPAILLHVHDAKVTRLVIYDDRERAFADLGLSE
jgi:ketosteroid isomerase-like protein